VVSFTTPSRRISTSCLTRLTARRADDNYDTIQSEDTTNVTQKMRTSSLVVLATTTMRSTSFPFRLGCGTRGGERIIDAVCVNLDAGVGDGGSGAWIRLKEAGDLRGFTEVFFLMDKGSTEAVEDFVGVLTSPS
jgi:hypothetical protein